LPPRRTIQSYEDLEAYQRSFALLRPVYQLIRQLPDHERYDLASQMRRAAKSVPTNIAEGYAKKRSAHEFKSFLTTSMLQGPKP
jgi:four helix bundle protein